MIIILHGEDTVKSRKALETFKTKRKNQELVSLDGAKVNLGELKQALEAKSLFGQERLVILENFLGAKKSKEQEKIIEYLKEEAGKIDLILWEDQEVSRTVLARFPQARVQVFKLDPLLFRFLDTLKPGNNKAMITSFRQARTQEDVNLIFYLLVRQFRLLLAMRNGEKGALDEVERLAPWQRAKIAKQSQYFTIEKLLEIYRELLAVDYREKSGLAVYPLLQTLELFLANL